MTHWMTSMLSLVRLRRV